MHADRIQIDDARLQANLQAYLRTPAAEKIFEEFDTPWWMSLIGAAIVLTLACCMLPTIIWTWAGLQALGGLLRHGPLFMVSDDARRHPEKLRAIVAHGIIVGPDLKHALAVGTFLSSSEYSADWLAKLAGWMGKVYASPQPPADARPLWELLRDDTYRPCRRRRVPEPDAGGKELYLLDVEVDPSQSVETPFDTVLFAFVAQPGEKGEILQLPWGVTQGAVEIH